MKIGKPSSRTIKENTPNKAGIVLANDALPFVFISYRHFDSEKVVPIIKALYDAGVRVWYDDGINAGQKYSAVLQNRIDKCGAVIAFVSEIYMKSPDCLNEVSYAISSAKPVIPIMFDRKLKAQNGFGYVFASDSKLFLSDYTNMNILVERIKSFDSVQNCIGENGVALNESRRDFDPHMYRDYPTDSVELESKKGDLSALYEMGRRFRKKYEVSGKGGELSKALKYYTAVANAGIPEAQYKIGILHCDRQYISKPNYACAREWFERAGNQDYALALAWLGHMEKNGYGVVRNPLNAARHYIRAIHLGIEGGDIKNILNRMIAEKVLYGEDLKRAGAYVPTMIIEDMVAGGLLTMDGVQKYSTADSADALASIMEIGILTLEEMRTYRKEQAEAYLEMLVRAGVLRVI